MKFKIFSIHDSKAGAFYPPFFLVNEGQAVRAFSDCVCDGTHAFSKHPEDYTLFQIGEYDDSNGSIVPMTPLSLGNGVVFVSVN